MLPRTIYPVGALLLSSLTSATLSFSEVLATHVNLTTFTAYLESYPELLASLNDGTNITVLAPTNAAFVAAGQMPSGDGLEALLEFHLLDGAYLVADFKDGLNHYIPTKLVSETYTNVTGGQIVMINLNASDISSRSYVHVFSDGTANFARITSPNLETSGALLHVVDRVLKIPERPSSWLDKLPNSSTLLSALKAAGILDELDFTPDATLFAPTNAAFFSVGTIFNNMSRSELAGILRYHIINSTVFHTGADNTNGTTLQTLHGEDVTMYYDQSAERWFANDVECNFDIEVANGNLVHVHGLLNPARPSLSPSFSSTGWATASDFPTATAVLNTAQLFANIVDYTSVPSTGLGGGAKCGIGIGIALLVIIVFCCLFLLFRRRRKQRVLATKEVQASHPLRQEPIRPEKDLAMELEAQGRDTKGGGHKAMHRSELGAEGETAELEGRSRTAELGGESKTRELDSQMVSELEGHPVATT